MMDCQIHVYTGDRPNAGTDANVKILLHDENKTTTPEFCLDAPFRNDFERGHMDDFKMKIPLHLNFGKLKKIELYRDAYGFGSSWYVDRIVIEIGKDVFVFPVFRWIKSKRRYLIPHLDTSLPQQDEHPEQRQLELKDKREVYRLIVKVPGFPAQVAKIPEDENFSQDYRWDLKKLKYRLGFDTLAIRLKTGKWEDLESLKNVFIVNRLPKPRCTEIWTEDSHFGEERVAGTNPVMLKLCTEIPNKFGVTDEMVGPFLEGMTIQEAIDAKRLFLIDLEMVKDVPRPREDLVVCVPIALLFEKGSKELVPVAIQLFQEKGPNNPVFLPSDPPMTWLLAKMWYNNADSAIHQACTHLGFTHLMMEGISVITHRNLSQSHPIFKLLAPHFLYLIAINTLALEVLLSPGGWIDKTLNTGVIGTSHLVKEGTKRWRMDVEGTIPEELKRRGLLDADVLHFYPYRDDALMVYYAIKRYVTAYVNLYYDSPDKLEKDFEIQAWAEEMVKPREQGGCGIKGVPGNGHFTSTDQLVLVLCSIISTCSLSHGCFNFGQYEAYAFCPNYPLSMRGKPPTDKRARSERDIVESLADKPTCLDTMIIITLLSQRATNALGDFEVNFIHEPKALEILNLFRIELATISKTIKEKNKSRERIYEWLDPELIPNSISI